MSSQTNSNLKNDDNLSKLIIQELGTDPFRKFKVAFALMTVIPFLVFIYLLVARLFSVQILFGDIGLVISISIFISFCGFLLGYGILRNVLTRVMFYAAKAKHSDQLKSTFVATVSHELKNPLAIIKVSLDNIKEGLLGAINQEQKRILALCQDVAGRMSRLISDLLDLHKIEAGMFQTKRGVCNLTDILEKQIKEFEILLDKKQIKLSKVVLEKEMPIWADELKMMQVVNNLLGNAIKYTPDGGSVTLRITPSDGFVRLECSDSGPGIPVEKLNTIFDKFERLDTTKEGTGLGLAITKDIVEMHQGKIWAESSEGSGSKFVVVLPRDLRAKSRR
jgi:signal transduction histidine kinase